MTPLKDVGEVIAIREFSLADEPQTKIRLLVGKPQKTPGHEEYFCPFQIVGAGDEKVRAICGIDPLQALQLTVRILGVELETLNRELGGRLCWLGEPGDFGFEKELAWARGDSH